MTKRSSSSLFLIELIIALLLFIVTAAVCVQAFGKAQELNARAELMDFASNECSSVCELTSSADSYADAVRLLKIAYPELENKDEIFACYYDADYKPCDKDGAAHKLTVKLTSEGGILICQTGRRVRA